MRIAVLMTCHNRRERTVQCLRALDVTAASAAGVTYHVYLVDDGSSDGTAEEVEALGMPVTILFGSGDLYWNRGMHLSWTAALASDASYEAFLLLNDDTVLDDDALARLAETARRLEGRAIVVGAVRDGATRALTYGGVRQLSQWHPGRVVTLPESGETQKADTFNGNCVFVPAIVCDAVGILDPTFQHGMGDFDYGYRARQHGFEVIVAPDTVGKCSRNPVEGTWRDPGLPTRRRLRLLASPKGLPRQQWQAFLARHGAPAAFLLAWMPTLRVLFSSFGSSMVGAFRSQARASGLGHPDPARPPDT